MTPAPRIMPIIRVLGRRISSVGRLGLSQSATFFNPLLIVAFKPQVRPKYITAREIHTSSRNNITVRSMARDIEQRTAFSSSIEPPGPMARAALG